MEMEMRQDQTQNYIANELDPSEGEKPARAVTFEVPGQPMGKPRMTKRDQWKKRPAVEKYKTWADKARSCIPDELRDVPADRIQMLSWVAVFKPPQSWTKKKKKEMINTFHRTKPDRDNIDKALLDAMFKGHSWGGLDGDDAAICSGMLTKMWGETPRMIVTVIYERLND